MPGLNGNDRTGYHVITIAVPLPTDIWAPFGAVLPVYIMI